MHVIRYFLNSFQYMDKIADIMEEKYDLKIKFSEIFIYSLEHFTLCGLH